LIRPRSTEKSREILFFGPFSSGPVLVRSPTVTKSGGGGPGREAPLPGRLPTSWERACPGRLSGLPTGSYPGVTSGRGTTWSFRHMLRACHPTGPAARHIAAGAATAQGGDSPDRQLSPTPAWAWELPSLPSWCGAARGPQGLPQTVRRPRRDASWVSHGTSGLRRLHEGTGQHASRVLAGPSPTTNTAAEMREQPPASRTRQGHPLPRSPA